MHIARIHKDVEVTSRNPKKPPRDQLEQELLEDSIHVLKIYNMLQKMKK